MISLWHNWGADVAVSVVVHPRPPLYSFVAGERDVLLGWAGFGMTGNISHDSGQAKGFCGWARAANVVRAIIFLFLLWYIWGRGEFERVERVD